MMRSLLRCASVLAVVVSLLFVSGCGSKTPAGKKTEKSPAAHEHHEGDGHDHSKDKTK
jgi:predicted component of type VI protein secretion system